MTPLHFEASYGRLWQELEDLLARLEGRRFGRRRQEVDAARLAALYRRSCEHLALARARAYPIHLTDRLEALTHRAHQAIYRRQGHGLVDLKQGLLVGLPQAVRAHGAYMAVATAVFVLTALAMGVACWLDPGFSLSLLHASQVRSYGGNFSGPIIRNRWGFFMNVDRRVTDENDVINATVLDEATLQPEGFVATVLTPSRNFNFDIRTDYLATKKHTIGFGYRYNENKQENLGIGTFDLPERGFNRSNHEHTLRLSLTSIVTEHAVNEMRMRKRDVEGTLEQSIASLTYALEFVRTQDSRDDKVRMLRPRTNEQGNDTQRMQGGEAAMLG